MPSRIPQLFLLIVFLNINLFAVPPLPEIQREFRAAWIPTVHNLDWPSRSDLSTASQKEELRALLDTAQSLNLNAVFLQVRAAADSFYISTFEPWSKWLTGEEGREPRPFWDPLDFAIEQAHQRGLELHAWLNPFRAGQVNDVPRGSEHILRRAPELLRIYNGEYWLDPGDPRSRKYIKLVVSDISNRYDLDGIHLDDYFYPYPVPDEEFNDQLTYQAYGGSLEKGHWRRANINIFVRELAYEIKKDNPFLIFGISPFGIWKDNVPFGVRGLDSFSLLYADSRLWFSQDWVDYLVPQFYWPYEDVERPFPKLFDWWQEQQQNSYLFAGINVRNIQDSQESSWSDVRKKINYRRLKKAYGDVFYSLEALQNVVWFEQLQQLYSKPALPPIYSQIQTPELRENGFRLSFDTENTLTLQWELKPRSAKLWVLYTLEDETWQYHILPGVVSRITIPKHDACKITYLALRTVDRGNRLGVPSFLSPRCPSDKEKMRNLYY